ncbi:unnamed protein product [Sphagnum jensenii]|uniref:Uncharacterized protein n=1 Tax=Sphagnum jensenii TaxID=128206 RepID=A0ABP0VBP9_9BRYO
MKGFRSGSSLDILPLSSSQRYFEGKKGEQLELANFLLQLEQAAASKSSRRGNANIETAVAVETPLTVNDSPAPSFSTLSEGEE